ncbi:hypothetical protein R6Q59_029381 [Mikania micrantha]
MEGIIDILPKEYIKTAKNRTKIPISSLRLLPPPFTGDCRRLMKNYKLIGPTNEKNQIQKQRNQQLKYNSEDDFESPNSKRSPQLNLQSTFIPYDIQRRVRIHNYPINLKTFIDVLNVKQKAVIKKIGFGSILDCKITSLPTCMGYWLLLNDNPTTSTLNLGSLSIKITSKLVNQVLGIPCGSLQIKELSKPSKRDPIVAEFRSQILDDIGLPEISHVKDY